MRTIKRQAGCGKIVPRTIRSGVREAHIVIGALPVTGIVKILVCYVPGDCVRRNISAGGCQNLTIRKKPTVSEVARVGENHALVNEIGLTRGGPRVPDTEAEGNPQYRHKGKSQSARKLRVVG